MIIYHITAEIEGTGRVQHVVRGAHSEEGAKDTFQAAYPGKTIKFLKILKGDQRDVRNH